MANGDELAYIRFRDRFFVENTISLTDQEIQEFKQIVKKVKDIDLTDEEAEDQAIRMIKLAYLVREKQLLEENRKKTEE